MPESAYVETTMARRRLIVILSVVALSISAVSSCARSPREREARFLKSGQEHFAKKDYPRAILDFQNAAQAMPRDAEPQYRLGLTYLTAQNIPAAFSAFRRATELNPGHWQSNLKLSELMSATRNKALVEDAARRLQEVLRMAPGNTEARDALAVADFGQGSADAASALLEETLRKFPSHVQSAAILARLRMSRGDYAAAERTLRSAERAAPESAAAALAIAEVHLVMRNYDKAEADARTALRLDPNNSEALWTLAASQLGLGLLDEADQTWRQLGALKDRRFATSHALFLYFRGRRDAAIAELNTVLQREPESREARSQLVAAYIDTANIAEAQRVLDAALKRNPRDADALIQRSVIALRTGNAHQAQEDLQSVLRFRPESATAHYLIAIVYEALQRQSESRQELERALQLNAQFLQARIALARSLTVANEPKAAVHVLDAAPESQKNISGVIIERNWALLKDGDLRSARTVLDRIMPRYRLPELLLQDSALKLSAHDYSGARMSAEEALSQNQEDARAARAIAQSYAAENRMPKALQRLQEIAAARPKCAALQELLGSWYAAAGKTNEARAAFESARSLDLKSLSAEIALAELDRRDHRLDSALQRLRRVLAAEPGNLFATTMLADYLREAGDLNGAISEYQAALRIDGSNALVLNNLAYLLGVRDPRGALQLAERAEQIAPDNPGIEDTLGWIYYCNRNYMTAISHLKIAMAKHPSPQHRFHLAMCYLKLGNRTEGAQLLAEALKQDPNLPKTENGW